MERQIHPVLGQPDDYLKVIPSQYPQFLTPRNETAVAFVPPVAPEAQPPPPSSTPLLAQQSQAHSKHSTPPLVETDDALPNTVSASLVADEKSGRGKAFTSEGILALSKAWVEQSSKGCNQNERSMWRGTELIFRDKYNLKRSAISLKSTWHRTTREVQHFISSRMRVR